jgi:hypothetical protein
MQDGILFLYNKLLKWYLRILTNSHKRYYAISVDNGQTFYELVHRGDNKSTVFSSDPLGLAFQLRVSSFGPDKLDMNPIYINDKYGIADNSKPVFSPCSPVEVRKVVAIETSLSLAVVWQLREDYYIVLFDPSEPYSPWKVCISRDDSFTSIDLVAHVEYDSCLAKIDEDLYLDIGTGVISGVCLTQYAPSLSEIDKIFTTLSK